MTASRAAARRARAAAQPTLDVLVVEDDAATLDVLTATLRRAGLACAAAGSATQALALTDAGLSSKVIVSDIRMPDISGLEFVEQLFRDRSGPRPEIVFVSGHAGFEDAVSALRLGARDLLRKPIDVFRLIDLVRAGIAARAEPLQPPAARRPRAADDDAAAQTRSVLALLRQGRILRARHLPDGLSGEPCWEMLLDLYDEMRNDRPVSVTSLAGASGLPTTSALRRIRELESGGLVQRHPDPRDGRREFVQLTDGGIAAVEAFVTDYLAAAR